MEAVQLGERIRSFRETREMSQEMLASLVGKDQDAISEYERGVRKLPAHELPAYSKALGVPISFFFAGELKPDEMDLAVVEWFHTYPTEKRRRLFTVIQNLMPLIIGEE